MVEHELCVRTRLHKRSDRRELVVADADVKREIPLAQQLDAIVEPAVEDRLARAPL